MNRVAVLALACGLSGVGAEAHPLNWTRVEVRVEGPEVELRVEVDLAPAFGGYLGYFETTRQTEERVVPRLREAVDELLSGLRIGPPGGRLEFVAEEAILPDGNEDEFLDSLAAPMTFVRARAMRPAGGGPLEFEVLTEFRFDQPVVLTVEGADERAPGPVLRVAGGGPVRFNEATAPADGRGWNSPPKLTLRILRDYGVVGFLHIVPRGWDHALFVLGLFLLAPRWRPLLWQVTAFTAAHTVTLGLAAAGWVSLPERMVEPLIALSIAWVAVENIVHRGELHRTRVAVVFGFGLLHGLGFAGVLGGIGLPPGAFLPALAAFNLGVEAGQVAVLAAAFGAVGWWRDRPWYRKRIALPASTLIVLVALFWMGERAWP